MGDVIQSELRARSLLTVEVWQKGAWSCLLAPKVRLFYKFAFIKNRVLSQHPAGLRA